MAHAEGVPARFRRRAAAMAAYGPAVSEAARMLGDPDPVVRAMALAAMAKTGEIDPGHLARALTDEDPVVRRRACLLVARTRSLDLANLLIEALSDGQPEVVEAACYSLGELGGSECPAISARPGTGAAGLGGDLVASAVAALCSVATSHGSDLCREAAVAALGSLGDERGEAGVLAAMGDKVGVRRRAVVALAGFDSAAAEAALAAAAEDRDWQVRDVAEDLLGRRPAPP